MRVVFKPLDLTLLGFQHLLHEEHLSLLVDQLVAVLFVLGTLDGDGEAGGLSHVDLALELGVDRQGGGLDVGLAYLAQTTFPRWTVFLPDFERLVLFLLTEFPFLFFFFE